ncbi:MAG: hypothetical protein KBG20_17395 [Caldilineaceae bacterium]|nr:hypothetical protein [Caldilineaceae bacterium]MBP8107143.1 hypothetical protein [Caldilineaceae bacterium]MBP8121487.1 hypothetical protein [Caldilineaceae bacterium]MBP9074085.1 hypothetical protein [Caldilineaceae bacterium]
MIRHFNLGDILLLQRLGRQAAILNIERAVTSPRQTNRVALTTLFPWLTTKVITHVLQQEANGLARSGIVQLRKRLNRAEADVVFLAPDLASSDGHPAIWQKLLPHAVQEAANLGISRVFVDLPDQPLPIETFCQVGFTVFTRETVWRLSRPRGTSDLWPDVRPQTAQDEWGMTQLYGRAVPKPVQQAEGAFSDERGYRSPIVQGWLPGESASFVLWAGDEIHGVLRITEGERGVWLDLWLDPHFQPDQLNQLIHFASSYLFRRRIYKPIYLGVRAYQGGMKGVLDDFGFAPVTDRVRLVKQVLAWAKAPQPQTIPALEAVREALPAAVPISKIVGIRDWGLGGTLRNSI